MIFVPAFREEKLLRLALRVLECGHALAFFSGRFDVLYAEDEADSRSFSFAVSHLYMHEEMAAVFLPAAYHFDVLTLFEQRLLFRCQASRFSQAVGNDFSGKAIGLFRSFRHLGGIEIELLTRR